MWWCNGDVLWDLFNKLPQSFVNWIKTFSDSLGDDKGDWGTFGDFIGGTLNPILSFLALIVLLRTYAMQREELKKTEETQKRQQFESTFFELLKLHNQVLEDLTKDLEQSEFKEKITSGFMSSNLIWLKPTKEVLTLGNIKKEFDNSELCEHYYFRVLYQLLKFIAVKFPDNGIDDKFKYDDIEKDVSFDEKMYSNIVRASLSDDVIKLLAIKYYKSKADDPHGYGKTKLLMERYSFFEREFFKIKVGFISELKSEYEAKAFANPEIS